MQDSSEIENLPEYMSTRSETTVRTFERRCTTKRLSAIDIEDEQEGLNVLNNRFASYLEKIKELADLNIILRTQIDNFHQTYKPTQLSFQTELQKLRRQLNQELRQYLASQLRLERAEYDRKYYRNKLQLFSSTQQLQTLQQKLEADQFELGFLKEHYEKQQQDIQLNKKLYDEYVTKLNVYTHDYTNVIFDRMKIENYLFTLKEQILFEQEYNRRCQQEFESLEKIQSDSNNYFTKTELDKTLEKIREDYQKYNQTQITELEMFYQLKVESFRQEVHQDEDKLSSSNNLIEQNQLLEKQFKHLQVDLRQLREYNQRENEGLNATYHQLQTQLLELESHVQYSRSNTTHLTSEIDTYRCLLVNLIPSSQRKLVKISSIKRITGFTVYEVQGMIWVRI
ncbi:unnamed protein product [Adineta ricciae]|uniref:IF rod domain-containing protein n=1 Tax=Adineta ricciae TaxID=249248 RepID=A0A815S9U9_ADIRI|nr:unnamed protein product [Adineta ricciae]CAF1487331.1 unnamed protein product [Adineta ricciae]